MYTMAATGYEMALQNALLEVLYGGNKTHRDFDGVPNLHVR